jgi:Co/Zn/Cd efflux system component
VIADAATSVLAIVALVSGKYFGAVWLDPAMGIAGAVLVGIWAKGLLFQSGRVLLDPEMDSRFVAEVRKSLAQMSGIDLCDLHVWRVGKAQYACIVSITCSDGHSPDSIRELLKDNPALAHVTVGVNSVPVVFA